jgi:hypothetical protein
VIRAVLDSSAVAIFGTERGEALGETVREIFDEDDTVVAVPVVCLMEAGGSGLVAANRRIQVLPATADRVQPVVDLLGILDITVGQACALDVAMVYDAYLLTADPVVYKGVGGDTIHPV